MSATSWARIQEHDLGRKGRGLLPDDEQGLLLPVAVGATVGSVSDDNNFRVSTSDGDPALDQRLSDELDAYNVPAADAGEQRELTVKVEDEIGDLVAGLSGWTWGTSAGIAMVWVRQDQRRSGHGARLLEAAESIARERGCERVNVSSFTFQAPRFYEKHGYVEVGRTEALPVARHADVHFVKHLG